jgi:hypothetical protein
MAMEFDFITTTDRPALIGITTPAVHDAVQSALAQLGYKVHVAQNHGEFLHRYTQIPYQVVVIEETFAGCTIETNESLQSLQPMLMTHRRHSVFVLVGTSLATFNPLQAFQYGVHAVLNPNEIFLAQQLLEKTVADNDMFMHTFRDSLRRLA